MHVLNNTQLNRWGTFSLDLMFVCSAHFYPPLQTLGILASLNCHLHQLKAVHGYHWALPKFPFFTLQPRNCRNKPWYSEDSFLFAFSFSGITVLYKLMSNIFWVIVSYIFVWCFGCFTICLIFVTSSITKAKILLTFYSVLWHLLMTAVLTSNNWFHLFIGAWWFFLKSSFFFF